MGPLIFAGTVTHDRPDMYRELLTNVTPQVDEFITVAHGRDALTYTTGHTILFDEPWNISNAWNLILDAADEAAAGQPYMVAIFNDDALVADDWAHRMIAAIERDGTAGASTPRAPGKPKSIFGGAFMIKGGVGIRMSGVARHYYSDDEVQKLCQRHGGFSIVPGVHAVNRLADQSTKKSPTIQAMNREDWPKFKALYGMPEAPWANTEYHVVISAPSGKTPTHIINTLGDRDHTVMVDGWETDQLAAAARMFGRFVYLKESARILPGFWEAIDSERGPAWLFARPSCYMGIYDSRTLKRMLRRLPRTLTKQDSINNEWRIHSTTSWRSIWPGINDRNPLRIETVDGVPEFVIGNELIEKFKSTARCPKCARSTEPGICPHLLEAACSSSGMANRR